MPPPWHSKQQINVAISLRIAAVIVPQALIDLKKDTKRAWPLNA
jgi:hypothetical protein